MKYYFDITALVIIWLALIATSLYCVMTDHPGFAVLFLVFTAAFRYKDDSKEK